MSKRGADTQREAWTSDFQSSDAPMDSPQKATAAQMALRKIRKPRRFATQPRPSGIIGAPDQPQNTTPSLFTTQGSTATDNVGQSGDFVFGQQHRVSQSFEQPASSNPFRLPPNVSFPPYQGSTNSDFKPAFAPPSSSDFAFTPPNTNNPFSVSNQNQSQSNGFQGSLFNIPPSTSFGTATSSTGGITDAPKVATQPVFNWSGSFGASDAQPKPQSNLFDTASTAPKRDQQPIFTFGQPPQSQQPENKQFGQSGSFLFGAKPSFNQTPSQAEPQAQSPSTFTPQISSAQEQQNAGNLNFSHQASSASQSQEVATSPRKDEDRMSTTPDSSPQPKGSSTLRPFEFLNHSASHPDKNKINKSEVPRDLFSRLSQPAVVQEAPANGAQASASLKSSSLESPLNSRNPAPIFTLKTPGDFAGFSQSSASARDATEQISPTRTHESKTNPPLNMPPLESITRPTDGLFQQLNTPAPSPLLQSPVNLAAMVSTELDISQTPREVVTSASPTERSPPNPARSNSGRLTLEPNFKDSIWSKTPDTPEDFSEAQHEQLAVGYQLRCVDVGLQQHILKNRSFHLESEQVTKFYLDLKRRILYGEGMPAQGLSNRKRKASRDDIIKEAPGKRTKLDINPIPVSAEDQVSNGGWLNAPNRPRSLLTEPALLPQVAISRLQPDERSTLNNASLEVTKPTSSEGQVSYPSLSPSTGSITSNLFKNILENKDQDSAPVATKEGSGGDVQTAASVLIEENINQDGTITYNRAVSLFTENKKDPPVSMSAAQPLYPSLQQSTSPKPVHTTSTAKDTPSLSFPEALPPSVPIHHIPQQPASSNTFTNLFSAQETTLVATTPSSSFAPPRFGNTQSANFFSQFGKIAEKNVQKEKASRKADDFDSDEDDEAEWERKDAEKQRAKKQKLDETVKNQISKFVPGKGFTMSEKITENQVLGDSQGISSSNSLNGISSFDNKSVLTGKSHSSGNGHNIFGHLSDAESGAEGSKIGDADDEETGSDGAIDDDIVNDSIGKVVSDNVQTGDKIPDISRLPEPLADKNPFALPPSFAANKSTSLLPDTSEQNHSIGRSIFDRISKDKDGKAIREITPPVEKRDENSVSASLPNNIFGQGNSLAGNNIFGLSRSEPGAIFFRQPPSETKTSIFGQKSSDTTANIFGQSGLESGTNTSGAQNLDDKAEVVRNLTSTNGRKDIEPTNLEVEAGVVEEHNLETDADDSLKQKSEVGHGLDGKANLEAETISSEKRSRETAAKVVEQVHSSASDQADVAIAPNSTIISSTPTPSIGSSTPLFAFNGSSAGDHTWKVNSPIKFGNSSSTTGTPGLTLTAPSPTKPSLGGLFGSSPANLTAKTSSKPPSSIFSFNGGKASTVDGFGFNFGGPPIAPTGSLTAPLLVSSATSRATSPGITTGDNSAAESNAEGAEEGAEKHEQLSLADKGPGEEDEVVLFAVKAKAMTFDSEATTWVTRGVGKLRVLQHRDTSKARILLKQDPSGKIILNAGLLSTMKYEHTQAKSVKLGVATDVGKLVTWIIRTGKDEDAVELARILEANKSN